MTKIFIVTLVMGLACLAAGASAHSRRAPPVFVEPTAPLDVAGCYFYRGRQFCGRYCYVEVNGKRYCQRFERDAHPQAEFLVVEPGLK